MREALAYAFGSMLCYSLADLLYKRAGASGIRTHHFIAVQAWVFAPTVLAYGLATRALAFGWTTLWGAAVGALVFTGFYNFAAALKSGAVSVYAPIFRLNFIVTAACAIVLLGEPLTFIKGAGLVLATAAAWLLLGARDTASSASPVQRMPLLQVVIATLAVGIANLFYKVGLNHGATPQTLLVAQAAIFITLATTTVWKREGHVVPPGAVWRYAPAAALLLVLAFVLLLQALARGEASVLVPVAQMGFIITAIAGFAFFKESVTVRKIAGLAAALSALVFLAGG